MRGPSSQCDSTGPSTPQPLSWAANPHIQQAPSHHCGRTTPHRSAPLHPAPSTTAKSTSFLFLTHTPSCTASSTLCILVKLGDSHQPHLTSANKTCQFQTFSKCTLSPSSLPGTAGCLRSSIAQTFPAWGLHRW